VGGFRGEACRSGVSKKNRTRVRVNDPRDATLGQGTEKVMSELGWTLPHQKRKRQALSTDTVYTPAGLAPKGAHSWAA